ncbi:MAG: 50S ribosomal protein L5 [Phycisphaerales bacterium]|nr:50S ribosomal protein L5 [Phycisphaerales bacterium]
MARLLDRFRSEIAPALAKELAIDNPMAIPRLKKVVLSMGVGKALQDKKRMDAAADELSKITGQKAQVRKAKKSVSNFKLREGYEIGCKVTLRGRRMYEFVDRLVNVAIPRMRDFRGLNATAFDGLGNYSMGVADQAIFPEVDIDKVQYQQGMNITFVTSAEDDSGARLLLKMLGLPFRASEEAGRN